MPDSAVPSDSAIPPDGAILSDGAILADRVIPTDEGQRANRSEPHQHIVVLALSLLIICTGFVLRVQDGQRVTVLGGVMIPELCVYKIVFHRPCPGCGLTRSVVSCAHGDLTAAFHYNELGVVVFVLLLAQIPLQIGQLFRWKLGKPAWRTPSAGWIVFPMVGALFCRWLMRVF